MRRGAREGYRLIHLEHLRGTSFLIFHFSRRLSNGGAPRPGLNPRSRAQQLSTAGSHRRCGTCRPTLKMLQGAQSGTGNNLIGIRTLCLRRSKIIPGANRVALPVLTKTPDYDSPRGKVHLPDAVSVLCAAMNVPSRSTLL